MVIQTERWFFGIETDGTRMQQTQLKQDIRDAIDTAGYRSSWKTDVNGLREKRRFMQHHLDAIMDSLWPVVSDYLQESSK